MPVTESLRAFVLGGLHAPPSRVLEVGAGDGALADELRAAGHDVLAIDPGSETEAVQPIALADLDVDPGSFDAAVAVVSLHHVHPLERSFARLADAVRAGGMLVVDEIDIGRVDERAAGWWLEQRRLLGHDVELTVGAWIEKARQNIVPVESIVDALVPFFETGPLQHGSYLHRWHLDIALQDEEERLIEEGALPAVGVRFVARRVA